MHTVNETQYAVVQLLQLPSRNIRDYVCIPRSWIKTWGGTNRKSLVAYPNEHPSITKRRVMNCENPSHTWSCYTAIVKRVACSYEDAYEYIMTKTSDISAEIYSAEKGTVHNPVLAPAPKRSSSSLTGDKFLEPPFKISNKKLKVDDQSNPVIGHRSISQNSKRNGNSHGILRISRDPLTFFNQILDSFQQPSANQLSSTGRENLHHTTLPQGIQNKGIPNLQTFSPATPKIQTRNSVLVSNPSFVNQNPATKTIPSQVPKAVQQDHPQAIPTQMKSVGQSSGSGTPSLYNETMSASIGCPNTAKRQDFGPQVIFAELTDYKRSHTLELSPENKSSVVPKTIEELDQRSNSPEVCSEEILSENLEFSEQGNKTGIRVHQLVDLFQNVKVNYTQTCKMVDEFNELFNENHKSMEIIDNATERLLKALKGTTGTTTIDVTQAQAKDNEKPNVKKVKHKKKNDSDDDYEESTSNNDDDENGDRGNEAAKTPHSCIRTFALPPEYDPDDTRWTLKYRENDPKLGLVELIPNSNVYINAIKLAHCKRTSHDCKALARMLLVEIFNQNALSVCSYTGKRANAFTVSRNKVRPGLDENARMVLLTFVENYSRVKKWGEFKIESVRNSLRSKIQDIRAKYGKTK